MIFDVTRWPLPVGLDQAAGWGSELVSVPGEPLVIFGLPNGGRASRWAVADLKTGDLRTAHGLHGEVRDGVFTPDGGGWLLTTFAICRVSFKPELSVSACDRPAGMGTYLWRLLDLGSGWLGATGWTTSSIVVIDSTGLSVRKRVRLISPHLALRRTGAVRLLAPHGGEWLDLELPSLNRSDHGTMPTATGAVQCGDELWMLAGDRVAIDEHVPIERAWRVRPSRLLALDLDSLSELRAAAAPRGAREVLGADSAGRMVISTDNGVSVVDADSLVELGRVDMRSAWQPLSAHAFVPTTDSVVAFRERFEPAELIVITWKPR